MSKFWAELWLGPKIDEYYVNPAPYKAVQKRAIVMERPKVGHFAKKSQIKWEASWEALAFSFLWS